MSQSSAATNRRRMRRQPSKGAVKVRCQTGTMGLGANLARKLLDVSTDGARLVVAAALESGQEVTLSLEAPWHARPITRTGRIRWCAALADGSWCVGVHFDKTLAYREVQDRAAGCG
jgi:hypothetical protein